MVNLPRPSSPTDSHTTTNDLAHLNTNSFTSDNWRTSSPGPASPNNDSENDSSHHVRFPGGAVRNSVSDDAVRGEGAKAEGTSLSREEAAKRLQQALEDRKSTDPAKRQKAEDDIPALLRAMGATATNPEESRSWYEKAHAWANDGSDPEVIAKSIALGIGAIVAAPFAIAGAALGGAGVILYGVGKIVQGVGMGLFAPAKAALNNNKR